MSKSKLFFKTVQESFSILSKNYADGVFTQSTYIKASNAKVKSLYRYDFEFHRINDVGLTQINQFQMYFSF